MHKWKNSYSWNRGQRIEKEFAPLLRQRDPNYRKANREEQFRHIDYFSNFGTIDVKAKKKINRSDSSEQEELVWVEFKNVQGDQNEVDQSHQLLILFFPSLVW